MNPTFKDRPWNQRLKSLGDEAETVYETWATQNGIGFHRSGINRPPFNVGKLPKMVAYTPDYLTDQGYVEVQGFGKDRQIKLKVEKLEALTQWDMVFHTEMFLWDNVDRTVAQVPVMWFLRNAANDQGVYPEGKHYQIWDPDRIPCWESYGA